MGSSNSSNRKIDWKRILLYGCGSGLGAFFGGLLLDSPGGAAIGAVLGVLVAALIGRLLSRSA